MCFKKSPAASFICANARRDELSFMASEAHLWKVYENLYYSPMAPNKLNKHTLEANYSEWDISMAGSVTASLTL